MSNNNVNDQLRGEKMTLKIIHDSENDYVSIDFKNEIEAKSYFENGMIVRLDKKGGVIGIDITDLKNRIFWG